MRKLRAELKKSLEAYQGRTNEYIKSNLDSITESIRLRESIPDVFSNALDQHHSIEHQLECIIKNIDNILDPI